MKRKVTLFALAALSLFSMQSQVALYESFTAPFNPPASGWNVQNLSSPGGTNTIGWRQGNSGAYFNAITGAPDDYFAADKYSTAPAGATNTISCWLITPTLNLTNGAILQFATKTFSASTIKPERLQVYYSLGTGTNVGSSAGSPTNTAGTFTTIIMDVNPNLTPINYPVLWSALTVSLTGIATPTVGRIGFRYYVPNGGAAGANGNYIGFDEVRYQMPCARPNFFGDITPATPTVCTGWPTPLKIFASGPSAPTTYTWFTGVTTSTAVYTPTLAGLNEIWSLGASATGCQHLDISFITVKPSPTVAVTASPNGTLCAGQTATLTASGAPSYSWSGVSSTTANPVIFTAASAGAQTFTLYGTAQGCRSADLAGSITVSTCLGLEEAEAGFVAAVYPNPFEDRLYVKGAKAAVKIYNLQGQLMLEAGAEASGLLDTSHLVPGVYILSATDAMTQPKTFRLVKQ